MVLISSQALLCSRIGWPSYAHQLLSQGVFTNVAEAFSTMAAQLLDTLQRTETSLKKLNRVRKTEGDGSQLSDLDKILAQLVLDVQVCTPS